MRRSGAERMEMIRLVEQSDLSVRSTLRQLGIAPRTFYDWYQRYLDGGPEALEDKKPRPRARWNKVSQEIRQQVVDLALVDTYGASAVYRWRNVFDLGVAYNKVLDGVERPESGQAKEGDRSTILGLRYITDRSYAAVTYTTFENHEKDDVGRFFSGDGTAVYASYSLVPRRLLLGVEWDDLRPEAEHPGQYRVRFITAGVAYLLERHWSFFLLYRLENGRLSDGTPRGDDTLMLSVHFDF